MPLLCLKNQRGAFTDGHASLICPLTDIIDDIHRKLNNDFPLDRSCPLLLLEIKKTPIGCPFALAERVGFEPTEPRGSTDFECCKTLADSPLEQVVSGRFVKGRKPRRRKGLRTFRPVSARADLNQPRVQIKPRSCVKSRRSCAFARSQARKQRPRQRR